MLRELNVQHIAIDQPIDLEIAESIIMLAVYLLIPEAKNSNHGLATSWVYEEREKWGDRPHE